MAKLVDPLKELKASREAEKKLGSRDLLGIPKVQSSPQPLDASTPMADIPSDVGVHLAGKAAMKAASTSPELDRAIRKDFRVFLTLVWRHLLGVDPNPIQLDLAYWLQHGPDRAIIMAFRGFSKSWITGAYALWRLYCDADEKIMVISGSMKRAVATTNWALSLIMTMPVLAHMIPRSHYRQSGQQFDVGSCVPAQSASFSAFGIGGQLVGFRGTCIIPDDVETQTNTLTVAAREKIAEAVKEFESVLVPGGVIKYLGTPHDVDSLYMKLLRLRDKHKRPVYAARIWPALFPTTEQIKSYNGFLAPYITHELGKLGPSCVGHSTMAMRFTDDDLEIRRAAIGNSEFALQFMLDLSGSLLDKYPLKLSNLMVASLDNRVGPDSVAWGDTKIYRDLPIMGLDGDFFYEPSYISDTYLPYNRTIAVVDSSGRGQDETAFVILAELNGTIFWLHLYASKLGYEPSVLKHIAKQCVVFRVHELFVEGEFGDGMFMALLKPYLMAELDKHNKRKGAEHLGTRLTEIKVGKAQKEKRILGILEPVTQQHRLVVSKEVILYDEQSIKEMEGEDSRHRYAWGYQYTHITRERDCLGHEDRLDALASGVAMFAGVLGVDPQGIAEKKREERTEDWLQKLLDEQDDLMGVGSLKSKDTRVQAAKAQRR